MIHKNSLRLLFFAAFSLSPVYAHDAARLAALENKVAALEAAAHTSKYSFAGKAILCIVALCVIKRLCSGVTEDQFNQQATRTDAQYANLAEDNNTLLEGINGIRAELGKNTPLTFNRRTIPALRTGLFDKITNAIADTALYALRLPLSLTWYFVKKTS